MGIEYEKVYPPQIRSKKINAESMWKWEQPSSQKSFASAMKQWF